MLKLVHIPGIRYTGETMEQMATREAAAEAYNAHVDAIWKDEAWQRNAPMPSMQAWARTHGVWDEPRPCKPTADTTARP